MQMTFRLHTLDQSVSSLVVTIPPSPPVVMILLPLKLVHTTRRSSSAVPSGAPMPRLTYFAPSLVGALLWPALSVLLQLPQRPARTAATL